MTDAIVITRSSQVFYRSLVRWEKIDEIIFLTPPAHHVEIRQMVLEALDHVVLETALEYLEDENDHIVFLSRCETEFHDEILLDWLRDKHPPLPDLLQRAIRSTKKELRTLLHLEQE